MIGIIDYGMGNLHSVKSALSRIGEEFILTGDTSELEQCDGLLLPGVGSFRDAMEQLERSGLSDFIKKEAAAGKPLMGICLGMQLLFEESEENGRSKGLGLLPGNVVRFSGKTETGELYKVPHMGWNMLSFQKPEQPLLQGLEEGYVYFVHSYVVSSADQEVTAASAIYGDVRVPAVVGRGNVMGTQFHPEKSSELGMGMLKNFCTYVKERSYA
ncbi:imidazole glycerol phosphate synthase subunit HisH [Fictibacillus aquaticus]|uniref:Imidazole glycerol phosphate synthase subunit HisH n=1 Tax=Fictibacillus aquaticus TaxID=2021314 RepID=A0A235F6W0_9BACL|nr:imidazole glycerol phosphate synthase subunit HisH [Fictibacillus aquaticus]OYD56969.1 imidazole glycerol phosphate synthase subunit HisH [Fictibacillus aquaticus]